MFNLILNLQLIDSESNVKTKKVIKVVTTKQNKESNTNDSG